MRYKYRIIEITDKEGVYYRIERKPNSIIGFISPWDRLTSVSNYEDACRIIQMKLENDNHKIKRKVMKVFE